MPSSIEINVHTNGSTKVPQFPPGVQSLPVTAPPEHFISLLKRDGGVIIKNFASMEVIDQCNKDIKPKLDGEQRWNGEFFPVRLDKRRSTFSCQRESPNLLVHYRKRLENVPLSSPIVQPILEKCSCTLFIKPSATIF